MSKNKQKELSVKDKKYVDLFIETTFNKLGKITENDLKVLAIDLELDFELVKNYTDIVTSNLKPKEVEKVPVSPLSDMVREQLSPREGMAIMNGSLSELIDKNPANFATKGRNDGAIFRGNARKRNV